MTTTQTDPGETNPNATVRGWLAGRLPQDLYAGPVEVIVDRDEITVVGPVPAADLAADASPAERAAAEAGRIREFRERTRLTRMDIARELEHAGGRKVSWGATCG